MASRKTSLIHARDYHSALEATGDVDVGAGALRRRRKRLGIALLGVLLIVLAAGVYALLHHDEGDNDDPRRYQVDLRCATCGNEFVATIDPGKSPPETCPKCGERAIREVWACLRCGNRFITQGTTADLVCPKCKSRSIGSSASVRKSAPTRRQSP